jgi:hypothetical protein
VENIKDGAYLLGVNAYPVVANGEDPFFNSLFRRYMNTGRFFSPKFNTIAD